MIYLAIALMAAAGLHVRLRRKKANWPEVFLIYLLVGCCAVPFTFIGVRAVISPEGMQQSLHASGSSAAVIAIGAFALGLSAVAFMSLWLRGRFLLGPALGWSVFWFGVTYAHLALESFQRPLTPRFIVNILMNHVTVGLALLILSALQWRNTREASGLAVH